MLFFFLILVIVLSFFSTKKLKFFSLTKLMFSLWMKHQGDANKNEL